MSTVFYFLIEGIRFNMTKKRKSDTVVARGSWRTPKVTYDDHNNPIGLKPEAPKPPKKKIIEGGLQ